MLYKSFKRFLTEKINITKVNFGNKVPFTNMEFSKNGNEIFTFFEHENNKVVVSYEDKSLNFSILQDGDSNLRHSLSNINFKYMQTFYGEILYVFEMMCKKFNINEFIVFSDPNEQKVAKIYSTFVNNTNIRSILKDMGFGNYKQDKQIEDGLTFIIHHFYKDKPI